MQKVIYDMINAEINRPVFSKFKIKEGVFMRKVITLVWIVVISMMLCGCSLNRQTKKIVDFTSETKYVEADIVIVNVDTFKQAYELYKNNQVLFYFLSGTHDISEVFIDVGIDYNLNEPCFKNQNYSLLGYYWMNGTNTVLPHYVSKGYVDGFSNSKQVELNDNFIYDLTSYYELMENELVSEVKKKQTNHMIIVQEYLISNEVFSHYIATTDTKNIYNQITCHELEIFSTTISRDDVPETIVLQMEIEDANVHEYYDQLDVNGIQCDTLTHEMISGGVGTNRLNIQYQLKNEMINTYLYVKAFDNAYGELKLVKYNWDYYLLHKYELEPVEVIFEVK